MQTEERQGMKFDSDEASGTTVMDIVVGSVARR